MENLELRMYGLVPYNLSPIQQGIQFGHAVVEYSLMEDYRDLYEDWAKNWKTFIILNGGTTNNNSPEKYGSLNKHLQTLWDEGINMAWFKEPDLGDQLTAVTFIVDERVFNLDKYPPFYKYLTNKYLQISGTSNGYQNSRLEDDYPKDYIEWKEFIGGEKNLFLREFLFKFKLA